MRSLGLLLLAACSSGYDWDLPPGFPEPVVPFDNPMSAEKVELGRHLFYDPRLSGNQTQSCASCHEQARAFSDGRTTSLGSTGEATPRNSMGLGNSAYAVTLTWANPLLDRLERQAETPLFNEHPVELGLRGREDELLLRLQVPPYPALFAAAGEEISIAGVTRALASFQRTLVSGDAPFDRDELSPAARRGLALFHSERLECFHCHGGFLFSDAVTWAGRAGASGLFHNTGLYDPYPDTGVHEITGVDGDRGRFRAPSLRNVAVTAPYMHDGSIATLNDVLDHYAAGGRAPNSPGKSLFLRGFTLSDEERADVIAFLESLTDDRFLVDPRFANPW
jgi:cytochrome c peroxidase